MKRDFTQRFGFLVNDVARLYGAQFDRLARERIGLSRAQCRVLGALAMRGEPMSQAELAQEVELSAMTVGGLCERLEAGGWVRRTASASDRRAKEVQLAEGAEKALDAAMKISDGVQDRALAALSPGERSQLVALLNKARQGLMTPVAGEEQP
ncbi:MarR family winged helix-turn-helix transcriptional regulator [Variovorax sp. OV329]|uniref:MarR family winged helix-turn-helix transcriptional regulator n=1 Tax=Variovorax sp. OV329 TaxID=1882825 RepID=UPI0008E42588|nr:MarR family winged helix-turn-helix transcriptional regulator [Variovorax sp. OV329]SFM21000.1 transcriptional regulator, MarR family [Variovorax sp. OV329]